MNFENILEIPLTLIKQRCSTHRSSKLQMEIQKEKSELRRKKLEKRVQIASSRDTKGGRMKSPKIEDDDDDFLEDLVLDNDPKNPKKTDNVFKLETGRLCHES